MEKLNIIGCLEIIYGCLEIIFGCWMIYIIGGYLQYLFNVLLSIDEQIRNWDDVELIMVSPL